MLFLWLARSLAVCCRLGETGWNCNWERVQVWLMRQRQQQLVKTHTAIHSAAAIERCNEQQQQHCIFGVGKMINQWWSKKKKCGKYLGKHVCAKRRRKENTVVVAVERWQLKWATVRRTSYSTCWLRWQVQYRYQYRWTSVNYRQLLQNQPPAAARTACCPFLPAFSPWWWWC